jgi:hypothetical protein
MAMYASTASAVTGVEYPTERTAQRITMIFNDKELERTTDNAKGLIKQEFTRTAATELLSFMEPTIDDFKQRFAF